MNSLSRRDALRIVGASVGTVGLAGCLGEGGGETTGGDDTTTDGSTTDGTAGGETDSGDGGSNSGNDWRTAELTNVLTDETFSIDQFEKPVLVETFAVWCSNCKRQQDELINFHEAVGDDVVSVAVDIDQNEDAEKVRKHAESHGYDWYYAVAPGPVTRSLTDEFGTSMAQPPVVPMLLRCPDGSATRLKDGYKSTDFLRTKTQEC
ncbi:TlpA family protein disulfide reductase [Haloarchaeobius sp. DFWS5]|uniref:TlpA family protein disulfide reductase n=1 Tax=Haloarchaeobius sp. DFWS5 TaxID=3446114 RepID=UPI003EBB52EB